MNLIRIVRIDGLFRSITECEREAVKVSSLGVVKRFDGNANDANTLYISYVFPTASSILVNVG